MCLPGCCWLGCRAVALPPCRPRLRRCHRRRHPPATSTVGGVHRLGVGVLDLGSARRRRADPAVRHRSASWSGPPTARAFRVWRRPARHRRRAASTGSAARSAPRAVPWKSALGRRMASAEPTSRPTTVMTTLAPWSMSRSLAATLAVTRTGIFPPGTPDPVWRRVRSDAFGPGARRGASGADWHLRPDGGWR